MADAAKGGWLRVAAMSCASVRPALRAERNAFSGDGLGNGAKDAAQSLFDRNKAHGAAVLMAYLMAYGASNVPDRPPLFIRNRMPSMRMERSAAFTMS